MNDIIYSYKNTLHEFEQRCEKEAVEHLSRNLTDKINHKFNYILKRGRWKRKEKIEVMILQKQYKTPNSLSKSLRRWHTLNMNSIVQKTIQNLSEKYKSCNFDITHDFRSKNGLYITLKIMPYYFV